MDNEERRIHAEAKAWTAGTLLVAVLAVFAGWRTAQAGKSGEARRPAAGHAAPAGATSPRAP